MTTGPARAQPERPDEESVAASAHATTPEQGAPRLTRAGAAWVATAAALLLLVLLIIFILQNTARVQVHFLGFAGSLPLGMALLIAAVAGGLAVAVAGVSRVTQLRMNARRARRDKPSSDAASADRP